MNIQIVPSASVALAAFISVGSAADLSCDGIPLIISAPSSEIARQTCQAATRTLPILAQCGVILSQPQAIEVVQTLPGFPDCMGIYHCGKNTINILTPSAVERLRRDDSAFHAIPSAAYFESILAHELAHAAYDAVPCPYPNCLLTSEYVGYAMQVFSLPRTDQKLFEADIDLENRVSRYEISIIGLLMAPENFPRKVWAHFVQRKDGCAYVADMMRADFYLDKERP